MRDVAPRGFAPALLALLLLSASSLAAQTGLPLGHLDDATVAPKGTLRMRATTVWTRYDTRFTPSGVEPLGSAFTAEALGAAQLAPLGATQSLIATSSGSPFTLSLGKSRLGARGREEIVPVGFEYGLTSRVTLGVTIPVVRKRITAQFELDSTGANVGPNLQRTSSAAGLNNAAVQTQFAIAADQLGARLADCNVDPAAPGCAALLARESEAQALIAASAEFASGIGALYGGDGGTGQAFVPRAGGSAQAAIDMRIADFNAQYMDLLASGTDVLTARPTGAGGPAGSAQVQQYLHAELGRDSLVSQERTSIGDIEVGATALVVDSRRTSTRRLGTQAVLGATLVLPTGSRQSPTELMDMSSSAGAVATRLRGTADLSFGRVGLLATTVAQFNVRSDATAAKHDGSAFAVHLAPRWQMSEPLSFHAAYSHHQGNVSGSSDYVGGGVSLSTLSTFNRDGGPLPMEMRYTHLEAISGRAGTPKFFRDQIEVRIYFRILSERR